MKYTTPETKSLKLGVQLYVCGSGYAPKRSGELGTMKVKNVSSWD